MGSGCRWRWRNRDTLQKNEALPRLEKGRALAFVWGAGWQVGSGGVPGDVGAWGAGGGAVRGGRSAAVPGAWAGDVAFGALSGILLEIRAPSGRCGADPNFLGGRGLV